MYKILKADKDAYITNKIINSVRAVSGNTGLAGTLDLFKVYGMSDNTPPDTELSRLLVHFNLDPIRQMITDGELDISNGSFYCKLNLKDVYGGQPTPSNFIVDIFPLSASFTEGLGKDIVYYSDNDNCNFLSSSFDVPWILSGCAAGGGATAQCDYITGTTNISSTKKTQQFITGEEDLLVDVTNLISATLTGEIPDRGFRISFDSTYETNQHTYFVKRFASKNAFNEDKHPKLLIGYDDSILDDTQNLSFDSTQNLFLYNYAQGSLSNIVSGSASTQINGSNSLTLKLTTPISGGFYTLYFTGSQHRVGINSYSGIYSASIFVSSSTTTIASKLRLSSSIEFTPVWGSLDGTVSYLTGSKISMFPSARTTTNQIAKKFIISVLGLNSVHRSDENISLRLNIFDHTSPLIKVVRTPIELPGLVIRNVYYAIRDVLTNEYTIPFDTTHNSTKVSSDASGMFFKLDITNLTKERSYVIDILIITSNNQQKYLSVSSIFKVSDLV
jgi:hypothetical protein